MIFSDYLWLDSDKLKDVLDSPDDPPSLSPQQSQPPKEKETQSPQSRKPSRKQQMQSSDVLTDDVEVSERDIEEESPSGIITILVSHLLLNLVVINLLLRSAH